jgi:cytochrome P450
VPHFTRVVTEDHELGGVQLRVGDRVMVLFGSANRDERAFEDPDRFDVARRGTEHLAFGRGQHSCIGMQLADWRWTRYCAHSRGGCSASRFSSRSSCSATPRTG